MKKTIWTVGLIAALVLVQPLRASAINKEWSAVLGFLGGVLVANASCAPNTVVREEVYVQQPVIRERIIIEEPEPCGHYEYREQRVWVPGRWIYTGHGRCRRRVWQSGYYRTELVRVWVPARRTVRRYR